MGKPEKPPQRMLFWAPSSFGVDKGAFWMTRQPCIFKDSFTTDCRNFSTMACVGRATFAS